jgi:2-polyprenyl-6-methoxyphenol hydroxylase-like FAD-dependent oxidoreductase
MSLPSDEKLAAEPGRGAPGRGLDTEVLIAGAGPVGCWLAAELAAAGVDVLVLEARESRVPWSRGFVVHPRTLEIFDSRGAAQPLVRAGRALPSWHFAMGESRLEFTVLPTAFPFVLIHPQAGTEQLLEQHLIRSGGAVLRGHRVVDLSQDADRVAVRVRREDGEHTLTARFVVGCDGARSTVREAAGIGFDGSPDTVVSPSALVELADPPPPEQYMQTREQGIFFAIALPDGRFIVSTIDHAVMHEVGEPWTGEMVRDSVRRITGTDYGMGAAERVSTIGNAARQADRYRDRRVLLAGDAAHVHFPMGGQGMNLGVQDAHNLAWRLTAAVRAQRAGAGMGTGAGAAAGAAAANAAAARAADLLLDGYEAERRPAGERVLEDVRAQMALAAATGADGAALRSRFQALLAEHPAVNLQYARRLSGLGVRYPVPGGDADPRLGARVPDLELELDPAAHPEQAAGPTRLSELLRTVGPGRFVRLIVTGATASAAATAPSPADTADAGETAEAAYAAHTAFAETVTVRARSVLGPDWAARAGWGGRAEAIVIRPDGHVAAISALVDGEWSRAPEPPPEVPAPVPENGD